MNNHSFAFLIGVYCKRRYFSGAQHSACGLHPARDESSCGPRCPTRKVSVLSPDI